MMRIAILQLEISADSPSQAMQAILQAIDSVARHDPAPDLIVLPQGGDGCGEESDAPAPLARLESFRAGVAAKAKEWGVYIAIGLHELLADIPQAYSALFDPDGNMAARHPSVPEGEGNGRSYWPSDAGDVVLVALPTGVQEAEAAAANLGQRGGVFVVSLPLAARAKDRKEIAASFEAAVSAAGAAARAFWAVSQPAAIRASRGKSAALRTGLYAVGGQPVEVLPDERAQSMIWSELDIMPASADELHEIFSLPESAD